VIDLVERGYRLHGGGETVNPPSYFLRFPDQLANRIIALPASVGGEVDVAGIKWISSFPANVDRGVPCASAVVILNDLTTVYPQACLEGSIISAARTAASAALAAAGAGLIARYIYIYLVAADFDFAEIGLLGHSAEHAAGFADYLRCARAAEVVVYDTVEGLARGSDLIVFAATAGTPHITDPACLDHAPLVLHVSLRDLGEDVIRAACNVVDDVERCLKAQTSVHLVELADGNRHHVHITLHDVLAGSFVVPPDRPVVLSPFGLGVLDLVLTEHVYTEVMAGGEAQVTEDFFHDLSRHEVAR
jgi:2,3-diaminopropionate biosynthesis protein SbnB